MKTVPMSAVVFLLMTVLVLPCSAAWMANTKTISVDDVNQFSPVVAYNSIHDEFLVVWEAGEFGSRRISGIRVDSDGFPIGSSFFISSGSLDQYSPDITYDPVEDRFLVIWIEDYTDTDSDVYARFIPSDGPSDSLLSFPVINTTADQPFASLTYDPLDALFLVVWAEHPEGSPTPGNLSGLLYEADGEASTGILPIASSNEDSFWSPDVAWNDQFEQFLVVFNNGSEISGVRIDSSGGVVGSEVAIASGTNYTAPDVASCRGNYLVIWSTDYDETILDRMVTPDGLIGFVHNLTGTTDHNYAPAHIGCDDAAGEYLVSWTKLFIEDPTVSEGIMSALVALDGSLRESFIEYRTIDSFNYSRPNLVFGDHSKALVVWESQRPPDAGFYDIRGRLTGGRIFFDDFESGATSYWIP